jgi:hypothetical protein
VATFTEIKTAIMGQLALTSTDADTRVGTAINRHYRRITSLIGLSAARFVTRSVSTTNGVSTVTFTSIEKIDRIIDATTSTAIRPLEEVSLNAIRTAQPGTGQPNTWALQNTAATSVTIRLDTVPQTVYSLQADGWTSLSDLSGTDTPAFPASFHDILTWFVIAEELLKKEKMQLAAAYEQKAESLLSDLRFHLADSPTLNTVQGGSDFQSGTGGSSGAAGNTGGTAYTQTALLTFDRGAGITPFAVAESDAPYVANLGAEFIGNVTTDRLIGRDTAGTGESEQLTVGNGLEFTGSGGIGVANDGITDARLRNGTACSVIGRSANSTGDPADIAASTNNTLLARISNALAWVAGMVFDGSGRVQQIAFAAAQSASSDANTLDDYEEGSWTPVLGGAGGTSGQTYTVQIGRYVKVGKLVWATASMTFSAKGTITGNCQIQGLPFTVDNVSTLNTVGQVRWDSLASNWVNINLAPVINTTTASVFGAAAAAASNATALTTSDIANATSVAITLSYQASA